jgi:hypothetical protein
MKKNGEFETLPWIDLGNILVLNIPRGGVVFYKSKDCC